MRNLFKSWLVIAALVANVPTLTAQDTTTTRSQPDVTSKLRKALEQACQDANIPGASLAISLGDGSELVVTAGTDASPEHKPVSPEQRFFMGSIGKTYFAAMALDLIQQKKLDPDAKVSTYLSDVDWFTRLPNANDIKVIHLLRHESGLPRYVLSRDFWKQMNEDPDKSWPDGSQLQFILDKPALHPAGDGWAYSDSNYILLGVIMEKIAKETCYDYIKQKFLDPHQLRDTIPSNQRNLDQLCEGRCTVFRAFQLPERIAPNGVYAVNPQFEWCGGGYITTPRDLAKWTRLLYTGKLMEADYVSQMRDWAVKAPELGEKTTYGPGVMIRPTSLGESLGHDGIMPGYQASMAYWPEKDIAAALQVNTDATQRLGKSMEAWLVELVSIAVEN